MIQRYTHPDMGRIWSDQRKYETWLQVEIAAVEAMARAGIVPAEAARDIREKGAFTVARIEEIEAVTQHDVIAFTTAVAEHVGPVGALAALRDDVVGRHRHRAGAADARGLRSHSEEPRRADGGGAAARRRAPPHADDRPHARRARRADDVRPEAGALVRRAGARSRPPRARARGDRGGQAVGRGRHLCPPARRRSSATSARRSASSRCRSRRR